MGRPDAYAHARHAFVTNSFLIEKKILVLKLEKKSKLKLEQSKSTFVHCKIYIRGLESWLSD